MDEREKIIRLWFDMWLQQKDLGIDEIFTDDVIYIESWSPKYENRATVKYWFEEWTPDSKIRFLKEFGCNLNNYNPYRNSSTPQFKEEKANWF